MMVTHTVNKQKFKYGMAYHHFRLFHVPLDTVHLCNYTEFPSAWWLSHPHKKYESQIGSSSNSWGQFQKSIKNVSKPPTSHGFFMVLC